MIYGKNTKSWEIISNESSDPKERSHSWEMRKPRKTTETKIFDSDGAMRPLTLERHKLALKG